MSSNPPRPPHNGKKQFRFVVGPDKPFKKSPKKPKNKSDNNCAGEMFGMKFRDRELPAPPLENNSSMESTTKKTSMETTTRKSSVETTSKTTSETVKKMQVLPPQLTSPHNLRANGRLPSCLEVQKEFFLAKFHF